MLPSTEGGLVDARLPFGLLCCWSRQWFEFWLWSWWYIEDGESRNTLEVIAVGVEIGSVGEFELMFRDKGMLWPPEVSEEFRCAGSFGGVSGAYHPPCELVGGGGGTAW